MSKSKRLVFFGNERLATGVTTDTPVLGALIAAGYEIAAIIATHADPISRQKKPLEIGQLAHSADIPMVSLSDEVDLLTEVRAYQTEAAVLVAFGRIIPKAVIDLFPGGIVNIHPSLLPKYRGSTPIESVILDGEKHSGVSLMKLSEQMDAGPVYAQKEVELMGDESKQEIADKLAGVGAKLLIENLPAILSGQLMPTDQNDERATHTDKIAKKDGVVDFTKPAQQIEQEIRAYSGWPKSSTKINGFDVILTKVKIVDKTDDFGLTLPTGGGYLAIEELVAPSGRTMTGADFLRGYRPKN